MNHRYRIRHRTARRAIVFPIVLGINGLGMAMDVSAADGERGQLLYENHCGVCHESALHIRDKRLARSVDDINRQVIRWQAELQLEWSKEEINDVTRYLNATFYHY